MRKKSYAIFRLLPILGILIFIGLYIYSTTLYPGGSQADLNSTGFSWMNNYWCNLMNEQGMNGQFNHARPYAISAMLILCFSLMLFFVSFPSKFPLHKFWKLTIQIAGIISMLFAALIFTQYHDLMTILSSIFGAFVVIGIIWTVYKSKMTAFKISGVVCIVLLALNNYIYYSQHMIDFLPLIQKITFAFVLLWISTLNWKMYELKN